MRILAASDRLSAQRAAAVLQAGGIIAYPTDTTYALGVNALDPKAVERLIELKGRDRMKPISIAVADMRLLDEVVYLSKATRKIVTSLLPGAVTLVLPARVAFPRPITNQDGKVGVRIPGNLFCSRILSIVAAPVTATSANPSRSEPVTKISQFASFDSTFISGIDILIDGGDTCLQEPSTVVEIDNREVRLIREGAMPFARILRIVNGLR
jgi:L-threonylcarbamoyladenylate synthase